MKIKFLSVFLAFGIYAIGTSVMATESKTPELTDVKVAVDEKTGAPELGCPCGSGETNTCGAKIKGYFSDYLCTAFTKANADCGTFCNNLKSGAITPPATIEACMTFIQANAGKLPVKTFISVACNLLCSGKVSICQTCSNTGTRAVCGFLCCPIDESAVDNCMTSNGDSCKNYEAAVTTFKGL